jgi:hypothetical protein
MTTTELAADHLSDEDFALAERILDRLCAKGDRRAYSPSEIGRIAKAETSAVRRVLPVLVEDGNLAVAGNGAWRRYTFVMG